MLRRQWKAVVSIIAACAVCLTAALIVYTRLHSAATAAATPTPITAVPAENVLPTPAPLGIMVPQAWLPEYGTMPRSIADTVPPYGRTFPSGFGPPHAATLAELAPKPGCDPATSAPDPSGPCGWGAFVRCDDNPFTPACNQRLGNGTTCGFGLRDCIEAQLTCRLPVQGVTTLGGFVRFPAGDLTDDPGSNTVRMSYPRGYAGGILAYDRAYALWVPTSTALISPDGSHYAYEDQNWAVHDVGIVAKTDRIVSPTGRWAPLAYTDTGIYGVPWDPGYGPGAGLWVLQRAHPIAISRSGYWSIVGGGAAYGHPTRDPGESPNQLVRLDLKTGISAAWFERPQQFIAVIGFDGAGHPLVWAQGGTAGVPVPDYREIWLVTAKNSGIKLISGPVEFLPDSMSDANGIWLWSSEGVFLLTVVTDWAGVPHPVAAKVTSSSVRGAFAPCA